MRNTQINSFEILYEIKANEVKIEQPCFRELRVS